MGKHLSSEVHQKNIHTDVYQPLDEEIGRGVTFEQFWTNSLRQAAMESKGTSTSLMSSKPSPRRDRRNNSNVKSPSRIRPPIKSKCSPPLLRSRTTRSSTPLRSPSNGLFDTLRLDEISPLIFHKHLGREFLGDKSLIWKTDLSLLK